MTNKFDYQIEILQAAKEGKEVERRYRGQAKWYAMDASDTVFNFVCYEYRVKKEPEVIYSVSYKRGGNWFLSSNHFSEKEAEFAAFKPQEAGYPVRIRKFVEVLEDED